MTYEMPSIYRRNALKLFLTLVPHFAITFFSRLFWADAHLNEVGFMDLNGGARRHIPAKRTSHISSMTVFDDYLFWSDWNLREVIRADKWTGMNETVLQMTTQLPNDIRVSQ